MKSMIRNIVILVVVAGLGYFGYEHFFAGVSPTSSGDSLQTTSSTTGATTDGSTPDATTAPDGSTVGQDFLTLLLSVQSIKLDDSIFSAKAFTALQDFNRPIPPDTDPGRPDPFATLGVDGAAVSSQISTSNPSSVSTTASTLNGSITVGGAAVTRWFEYGTTNALGTLTTPTPQANPGAFSETITGLTPNTTYFVKAAASIGGVIIAGNLVTWTTAQGGTQPIPKAAGK